MYTEYYRGFGVMFNPITGKWYYYTNGFTSNKTRKFDTYEQATESIDNLTNNIIRSN